VSPNLRRRARMAVFLSSAAVFIAVYVGALAGLHPFGRTDGLPAAAYGDLINSRTVPERHITDAVTAVNFDFRGFDTLGEEFIMFASVIGAVLLLRKQNDETEGAPRDQRPDRRISPSSDAVRVLSVSLVGIVVLFGIYVVTHGQVTPGGGFQGGVLLAAAPLLIYLAGEFQQLRRLAPRTLVEAAEALGAGGYAVIGAVPLFLHMDFLYNFLPLGRTGDVFSSGTVALIDLSVGMEVAGGFIVLLLAFLEEALVRRDPI
jgi:multicomponent Na+:H+ antiporter subunit B